jgi:hypothetical protein
MSMASATSEVVSDRDDCSVCLIVCGSLRQMQDEPTGVRANLSYGANDVLLSRGVKALLVKGGGVERVEQLPELTQLDLDQTRTTFAAIRIEPMAACETHVDFAL